MSDRTEDFGQFVLVSMLGGCALMWAVIFAFVLINVANMPERAYSGPILAPQEKVIVPDLGSDVPDMGRFR